LEYGRTAGVRNIISLRITTTQKKKNSAGSDDAPDEMPLLNGRAWMMQV